MGIHTIRFVQKILLRRGAQNQHLKYFKSTFFIKVMPLLLAFSFSHNIAGINYLFQNKLSLARIQRKILKIPRRMK